MTKKTDTGDKIANLDNWSNEKGEEEYLDKSNQPWKQLDKELVIYPFKEDVLKTLNDEDKFMINKLFDKLVKTY